METIITIFVALGVALGAIALLLRMMSKWNERTLRDRGSFFDYDHQEVPLVHTKHQTLYPDAPPHQVPYKLETPPVTTVVAAVEVKKRRTQTARTTVHDDPEYPIPRKRTRKPKPRD